MTRKPSNPAAYAEAVAAADGYTVVPITGKQVTPDMELWHEGQWLTVRYRSSVGDGIRVDFQVNEPTETVFRFANANTELYRRFPEHHPVRVGSAE